MSAIPKIRNMHPRPRILIIDQVLPVMDGQEVTKEILKIEPDTKIILLADDNGVIPDAIRAGAFTVLIKPVSMYHLLHTIEGIVETYSNIKIR